MYLERYSDKITILRDDKLIGGTKSRFIKELLDLNKKGFIYCSLGYGAFQIALSEICRELKKECIIFTPDKKIKDPNTIEIMNNGAKVIFVPYGYMSVLNKRAKEFNKDNEYQILSFGGECEIAINRISETMKEIIKELQGEPDNIYCSVGSGTLLKGILKGTSKAIIHGIVVGKEFNINHERVRLRKYPKDFKYESKLNIEFKSNKNYDRKAFEYVLSDNLDNVLFWNVN